MKWKRSHELNWPNALIGIAARADRQRPDIHIEGADIRFNSVPLRHRSLQFPVTQPKELLPLSDLEEAISYSETVSSPGLCFAQLVSRNELRANGFG